MPPGGAALARIAEADLTGLDPRLTDPDLVLCRDVALPLLGPDGAAAVFGPHRRGPTRPARPRRLAGAGGPGRGRRRPDGPPVRRRQGAGRTGPARQSEVAAVLAVVGAVDVPATDLAVNGIDLAASTVVEAGSVTTAIRDPEPWVRRAAETAIRQHLRPGDHSGRWPGPAFPLV